MGSGSGSLLMTSMILSFGSLLLSVALYGIVNIIGTDNNRLLIKFVDENARYV